MIKIFKKPTLLLLLISSIFCSIFFSSCERNAIFEDFNISRSSTSENNAYFELIPKKDIEDATFYLYLYDYEMKNFAKIKYDFGNMNKGETYTINYDLETNLYPNKTISNAKLEISTGKIVYF